MLFIVETESNNSIFKQNGFPELICCKDCKHRPVKPDDYDLFAIGEGFRLEFPDWKCPCRCQDGFYSWYPEDNFFCGNGEAKDKSLSKKEI